MPISSQQIDAWSHQGSVSQSTATYKSIKSALEDKSAPYSGHKFDVYLQGSYGNDTNVYAESDVDIVICLTEIYNFDLDNLSPSEKAAHESGRSTVDYGFDEFKRDVTAWLRYKFGATVKSGKKAIFVPGGNARRDADVLVCIEHRRFSTYRSILNNYYHPRICFWTADGKKIINFPKQHRDNCTTKHQSSKNRLKPNIRVIKNMRNAMVDGGYIQDGVAPSYFLEGALWNMPDDRFVEKHQKTVDNFIVWFGQCDVNQLTCASGLHWLVRDGADVCWHSRDVQTFLNAMKRYWNNSGR